MIRIASFFLLCLYFCQCSLADRGERSLRKVNVVYKLPYLVTSDSIDLITDSSFIYYYKNFRIYEVPAREIEIIYDVLISDSLKSNFFVYDTTKRYGYYVRSLQDSIQKEVSVDSFIKTRPGGNSYDRILSFSIFRRGVSTTRNKLLKVYSVNDEIIDSAFFYYDKYLRHVPFSFSRELDSAYNSKLYQVELLMKKDTSKNANAFNKYRKITWTLNESKIIDNQDKIMDFLKKVEDTYKSEF